MFYSLQWKDLFRIRGPKSIYLYSLLIGVVSGFGAVAFSTGFAWVEHFTMVVLAGVKHIYPPGDFHIKGEPTHSFSLIIFFLLPIAGGLVAGLITYFLCPEAVGTGTDSMIDAFHHNDGKVDAKVPLYKALATIATLASGGSAGKEGPISQIGAGFGSALASILKTGARARRTLLIAGAAGGLGAIFRAPLGGAMTAVEMVYREDIESDSLIPSIIASVTAYLVYTSVLGFGTVYDVPVSSVEHYWHLLFFTLLGFLCFIMGYVFVHSYQWLEAYFKKLPIHHVIKPAIGGLIVSCIGLFVPQAMGPGAGILQQLMSGGSVLEDFRNSHSIIGAPIPLTFPLIWTAIIFLLLAISKMLTTSFSIGSGGSGGMFAPSLFIGAMLGGFTGTILQIIFPEEQIPLTSFMLVGMGAFYSGVASAPIAGMIMVCEMIGSYKLLPPLMIVSIIAFSLSNKLSIYRGQVDNRFHSPAHYFDMNLDLLEGMKLIDVFPTFRSFAVVPCAMPLSELEEHAVNIHASDYVIVRADGRYAGMISLRRIRLAKDIESIRNLITVEDAMDSSIPAVYEDESLSQVLHITNQHEMDKVAVVERASSKVLGYVRHSDIIKAYRSKIQRRE